MREIYLDNAATTAVIDCAMAAAENAMQACYGNAGSVHGKGRDASVILSECRDTNCRRNSPMYLFRPI